MSKYVVFWLNGFRSQLAYLIINGKIHLSVCGHISYGAHGDNTLASTTLPTPTPTSLLSMLICTLPLPVTVTMYYWANELRIPDSIFCLVRSTLLGLHLSPDNVISVYSNECRWHSTTNDCRWHFSCWLQSSVWTHGGGRRIFILARETRARTCEKLAIGSCTIFSLCDKKFKIQSFHLFTRLLILIIMRHKYVCIFIQQWLSLPVCSSYCLYIKVWLSRGQQQCSIN